MIIKFENRTISSTYHLKHHFNYLEKDNELHFKTNRS